MTGTTDFGKVSSSTDPQYKLAFEIFIDRILGFVGSYYIKLEGRVDALVFAGGIGEKGAILRTRVTEKCRCLGFEIHEEKNKKSVDDVVVDVGKEGARHRTLVCRTDEQVMYSPCNRRMLVLIFLDSSRWQEDVQRMIHSSTRLRQIYAP